MQYSPHQLAYFAHQLTLRGAANSIERMAGTLLTPHDAEAANVTLKNLAARFALRGRR